MWCEAAFILARAEPPMKLRAGDIGYVRKTDTGEEFHFCVSRIGEDAMGVEYRPGDECRNNPHWRNVLPCFRAHYQNGDAIGRTLEIIG